MQITAEYVRWAFRLFLDRDIPQDVADQADPKILRNTRALREHVMASPEFLANNKFFMMRQLHPNKTVIVEGPAGYRIFVDLVDVFISWGIILGCFEEAETRYVAENLKPGGCFVDVGANIGYFTLLARSIVGDGGSVYAFEPRSRVFSMLASSIKENVFTNVHAHRIALGAKMGTAELVFSKNEYNLGGSQLANGQDRDNFSREAVALKTLDSMIPEGVSVDLIKIDIEGAEPFFFEGARRTIARCRPRIVCEVNEPNLKDVAHTGVADLISMVEDMGYVARILGRDGPASPLDFASASEASPILTAIFEPSINRTAS